MAFLDRILDPPSYGYERNGKLYVPTHREITAEFFSRLNVARSRKNWLGLFAWVTSLSFGIPLVLFFTHHFSWWLMAVGFVYSMVVIGTHGTVWFHRYSTHGAYQFKNAFFRELCRNLVIKIVVEEAYVVSHHVHHSFAEQPGDPYNARAGWLYCFLADVNHQALNKTLDRKDYAQVCKLMKHTGVRLNSYEQYQRWGSLCHPGYTALHFALNWAFWYGVFFLIGGHALALALFGWAGVWAIGVRTYNYDGHGGGKDRRREGIDFNSRDQSINQCWPGLITGEWHNNHHLYPSGARAGFLPYQFDLAWHFIRAWAWMGAITSYRDYKQDFLNRYHQPWLARAKAQDCPETERAVPDSSAAS
ncbi:fatty acid desaturase [Pyxidicoccus parkwayensis]|uniref:Fatty acid desaturase n=1 Tax=Pyxidicoccus parkwayensis TaxID=2813578 RepID=A0ABX7P836_9BACT|nr:fatty acid desaturase [Pyxidicoccus parkwaysis]QSQ26608.1 fatty acid desaturase [Pyxidicoccus parkwaysis]